MLRIFDKYDKTWHNGYTLAEMLIVLLIVALVMMALPRATKKLFNVTTKPGDNGRLECFYDPNAKTTPTLIKHYATSGGIKITCKNVGGLATGMNGTSYDQCKAAFESITIDGETRLGCKFEPPKNAVYMVLHAVGGGGSGAWPMIKRTNDNSGTYYTVPQLEYVTKSTTVPAQFNEDKWGDWLKKLYDYNINYLVGLGPQHPGLKSMFEDFRDGVKKKVNIETMVSWQTKKLRYTNSGKAGKIISMYFPTLSGSTLLVVPGAAGTTSTNDFVSSNDYTKFNGKKGGDTLVYSIPDGVNCSTEPEKCILLLKARGGAAGLVYDTAKTEVMDAYISADQPSEDPKFLYDENIGREGSAQYEGLKAKPANFMALMSEGDGTTSQLISSYSGSNLIYPGDGGWGSFNVFHTTQQTLKRFYYINDYYERIDEVVSNPTHHKIERIAGTKWSNVSPYVVRQTAYGGNCTSTNGPMTTDPGFKAKFVGSCVDGSCTVGNSLDRLDTTCTGQMSPPRASFSASAPKIEQQTACATFKINGSVNTNATTSDNLPRCITVANPLGNPDYCKLTKDTANSNDPTNRFRLYGGAYGCYYDNKIGRKVDGEIVGKSAYSGRIVCELPPEPVPANINYVECPYEAPQNGKYGIKTKYPGVYECPNGTSSNNEICKPTSGGNGAVVLLW